MHERRGEEKSRTKEDSRGTDLVWHSQECQASKVSSKTKQRILAVFMHKEKGKENTPRVKERKEQSRAQAKTREDKEEKAGRRANQASGEGEGCESEKVGNSPAFPPHTTPAPEEPVYPTSGLAGGGR